MEAVGDAESPAGRVVDLTTADFDAAIAASDIHLVDFWAEWCGPCHDLAPVLDEITSERRDGVHVGKVDVLLHPELVDRFEIATLPTILVFRRGEIVSRLFGAKNKRQLLRALDAASTA